MILQQTRSLLTYFQIPDLDTLFVLGGRSSWDSFDLHIICSIVYMRRMHSHAVSIPTLSQPACGGNRACESKVARSQSAETVVNEVAVPLVRTHLVALCLALF
jgi:hypothetical protein